MRIALIHPDLGLGGAERLTVDLALSLQNLGHCPTIFTPHQDPRRTFSEVAPPNPQVPVQVIRTFVPRSLFKKLHAILAALRCSLCALYVCLFRRPDVAIVDIVSLPVLIFALFRLPVLFYCHYPDKLLADSLNPAAVASPVKRVYRTLVDAIEAVSLRFASAVVCNSKFTVSAYKRTFPSLKTPCVVYPCVKVVDSVDRAPEDMLLSLNRYERKKNVSLAVETLAVLVERVPHREFKVVIAGGYDERLRENVEYFAELQQLVISRGLQHRVKMMRNVSEEERKELLRVAVAVLYTPRNEHFGIVPLEAMAQGVPVVAVNSGGPVESVEDGMTGFLCEGSAESFANAVLKVDGGRMGKNGRDRVRRYFSREALGEAMLNILLRIVERRQNTWR